MALAFGMFLKSIKDGAQVQLAYLAFPPGGNLEH